VAYCSADYRIGVERQPTYLHWGQTVLILTRKIGESILVGDNIRLLVLDIRGRQIRVGIEAPADIVVLREEIGQRLADENLRAAIFNYQEVQQAVNALALKVANPLTLRPPRPESPNLTFESQALGQVTVSADHIFTFPSGLPGFPGAHRFALLNDHLEPPFYCLQSVDIPSLAFVVANPTALVLDYRPKNGVNTLKELQASSPEDLQVLVTLTIPPGRPQEITANLMSPLLINPEQGLGKQVVIEKPHYSHQHPVLFVSPGSPPQPGAPGEASPELG
jgi:flagellar assembly factor FliW